MHSMNSSVYTSINPLLLIKKTTSSEALTCPIFKFIFVKPVNASDGYNYEREALIKWLQMGKN